MHLPLSALIVIELGKSDEPLSFSEIQNAVTKARVREGLSPGMIRLIRRSPVTIFRLFRKIPEIRMYVAINKLMDNDRLEKTSCRHGTYRLTDRGLESLQWWEDYVGRFKKSN